MPKDQKEPQSYGSGPDWVTGKTGQEVNDQDSGAGGVEEASALPPGEAGGTPAPHGRDEESTAHPTITAKGDHAPVTGVTSAEGGTKTGGYFKKRDYD